MQRWHDLWVRASPTVKRSGHVVEVHYLALPGVREELTELAALESVCCSFVSWSVEDDRDIPVLRVSGTAGRPETIEPIALMFESESAH
jgi:hypothetical protein